jgi:molecular chaperone GrpE
MIDRQALLEKLLDYLQATPQPPEYLGEAPNAAAAFSPYQMVGEWIALRHEVKQQNRLLQTAQTSFQKTLEAEQLENVQLRQRVDELATKLATTKSESQHDHLDENLFLKDLLKIMDALDQACEYWRSQILELSSASSQPRRFSAHFLTRFWQALFPSQQQDSTALNAIDLKQVLLSNQQGIEVIQRSLLDLLRQRQVIPIVAMGKPFDPHYMYAIGREESASTPENTVIQEVVRGYLWQDQVLREAQVMVAARKA